MSIGKFIAAALFIAMLFFSGCAVKYELRLAAPFGSGAVLQRQISIPVWGKAAPRTLVRCTLGNESAVTVSDTDGNFRCFLPPMTQAENLTLTAEEVASGRKVVSRNIAVGDVYICAGQSNMEFRARHTPDWEKFSNAPADENIRYFKIKVTCFPGPQADVNGSWQVDSPESAADFSAVGYYFAKRLRQLAPDVPVGIISACLGGMPIETFISREALMKCKGGQPSVYAIMPEKNFSPKLYENLPENSLLPDGNKRLFAEIDAKFPFEYPALSSAARQWHLPQFDDSTWQNILLPDSWTVAGYRHAGVFWFRKTLELPPEWAGRDLTISLGAADKCDETFFNGEKIGSLGHFRKFDHFMTNRTYRIPGRLVKAGKNVIAVRVASAVSITTDGGLIGPAEKMKLSCGEQHIPLADVWKIRKEYDYGTWGAEFMAGLGPGSPQSANMLFDNMIYPLIPYAMRGVVWYQGEYNALAQAEYYQNMLLTLIDDWKTRWGQPNFDFIIIQLPGYQPVRDYQHFSQWAVLREAQRQAAQKSGQPLIVTLRDGEVDDIHPRNKRPVAERAADAAFDREKVAVPMPLKCRRDGEKLIVRFDNDIVIREGAVKTLMLSENGKEFFPASGKVVDQRELHIVSPQVPRPETVRYAWSNNPVNANLFRADSTSILVSPFEISAEKQY